jgi:sugar lactone lactonase YvrE
MGAWSTSPTLTRETLMVQRFARIAGSIAIALLAVACAGAGAAPFPQHIDLPNGFRPEGIVVGSGHTFYVGSIPTGAIYRGDLRTGDGAVITPAAAGSAAIGLAITDDNARLFVAGGPTGQGRVVDAATGEVLATHQFATGATFVNDVDVAGDAAWFTDSINPVLYRVPLDGSGFETVPLTGDLVYTTPGFNVNGIESSQDGSTLILVKSNTGQLYTADPNTGATREIDLGGETVTAGDGLLLHGKRLYVVQNSLNVVAVLELGPDVTTATVVNRVANDDFDVPTTIDRFGSRLYVVNARFSTPPTAETPYWITGFARP